MNHRLKLSEASHDALLEVSSAFVCALCDVTGGQFRELLLFGKHCEVNLA